jgi:Serine hydrolase (FSH1)
MSTTRILCLHGYHGSAAVLRNQVAPVAASLPAEVALVFVDAPSYATDLLDAADVHALSPLKGA